YHGGDATNPRINDPRSPMMVGWLTWGTEPANTNRLYLTDKRYASLGPYVGEAAAMFKCPSDVFLSAAQRGRGWKERVRTMSANIYVGDGNASTGPTEAIYLQVKKATQFQFPGPTDVWVFLDEHPDSMNDAGFFSPRVRDWIDYPASFHNGAGSFAMADGHSELRKWVNASTRLPVRVSTFPGASLRPGENGADIKWMRFRTPRRNETF
ncbi:MAG: hypothetical protein ACKOET_18345, partial [Verrucomicrobiota bacterium]